VGDSDEHLGLPLGELRKRRGHEFGDDRRGLRIDTAGGVKRIVELAGLLVFVQAEAQPKSVHERRGGHGAGAQHAGDEALQVVGFEQRRQVARLEVVADHAEVPERPGHAEQAAVVAVEWRRRAGGQPPQPPGA
jgi:hypothetical protein